MGRLKRKVIGAAVTCFAVCAFAYGICCYSIYGGLKKITAEAFSIPGGDKITALAAYVEDESRNLSGRNRAVWALGQIGDDRALPLLEKYFTGEVCSHERFLCQHELQKAIRKCRGGLNAASWVSKLAMRSF